VRIRNPVSRVVPEDYLVAAFKGQSHEAQLAEVDISAIADSAGTPLYRLLDFVARAVAARLTADNAAERILKRDRQIHAASARTCMQRLLDACGVLYWLRPPSCESIRG
jgi:hypothetical protein